MKRTPWTYLVSFTGIVLGIVWVTVRVRNQKAKNVPSDNLSLPSTQPVDAPPSVTTTQLQPVNAPPSVTTTQQPKKNASPNKYDRVVAGLLLTISAILLTLWLINLSANYQLPSPPPKGFEHAIPVPTKLDPSSFDTVSTSQGNFSQPHATLVLVIHQIKSETATEATLVGALDLTIPRNLQAQMCDVSRFNAHKASQNNKYPCGSGTPIAIQTGDGYQLKPEYVQDSMALNITNNLTNEEAKIPISLTELFPSASPSIDIAADIHIPLTLTIDSQGNTYPNDWYWSKTTLVIPLPYYIDIYSISNKSVALDPLLPVDVRVVANSGIQNLTVNLNQYPGVYPDINVIELLATRSPYFLVVVYCTALLIPLAFFIIIGHTFLRSEREKGEPLYGVSLNILVAVFTILAVRQVLVPPDLQGFLTRLDLWLITCGIALLVLVFSIYAIQVGHKKPSNSNGFPKLK